MAEVTTNTMPEFRMPTCHRHFFKGYRWWCRACRHEVERQFKDVCVALWTARGRSTPQECEHPDHLDAIYTAVACPGCSGSEEGQ